MSSITKEDIIQDIQETSEEVNDYLTQREYLDKGRYNIGQVLKHFDNFSSATQAAGLDTPENMQEEIDNYEKYHFESFKKFEEVIKNKFRGRYSFYELKDKLEDNLDDDVKLPSNSYPDFIRFLNRRDNGLRVTRGSGGNGGRKVFIRNENIDPYKEYKEMIPDKHLDVFKTGLNRGRSPKTLTASILYLTESSDVDEPVTTKKDAAEMMGVTPLSIRNTVDFFEEEGLMEEYLDE